MLLRIQLAVMFFLEVKVFHNFEGRPKLSGRQLQTQKDAIPTSYSSSTREGMEINANLFVRGKHPDAGKESSERNKGVSFADQLTIAREKDGDTPTPFLPFHALAQPSSFGGKAYKRRRESYQIQTLAEGF